jgi:hypothetical protein
MNALRAKPLRAPMLPGLARRRTKRAAQIKDPIQMTLLFTEQEKERFRKHAARMQASQLPFLSYKDGEWRISGEPQPINASTWIALTDKIVVGRYLFIDRKVAEAHTWFLRDLDGEPPRPNSFTDKSQWPRGSNNKPSDPWSLGYTLYLLSTGGNRIVEFKANTIDTRGAVSRLMDDFRETMRRPVVTLCVKPKPENVNAMMPDLEITSYSDNDEEDIPGLTIVLRNDTPIKDTATAPKKTNGSGGDMGGDEIPF